MKYSHIIWDFNGTILDDVKTGIDCVNVLLRKRGLDTIPDTNYYHKVFGFPIIDYYKRLGFDFEKESYHTLAVEWVGLYMKECKKAPLNKGVKEILDIIKQKGTPQYILSATEKQMLLLQLRQLGIENYFETIYGLDNIHAGGKTSLGLDMCASLKPKRALLIGDTTHDYETAKAMKIDCVLFSGGHMKKSDLEKCNCPIIDNIIELKEII